MEGTLGLHHVTCVAGDPQQNLDFYLGVLGLRLVKRSVNQDDPATYHFFYADRQGTPGTALTFFPYPHLPPHRLGVGQAVEVALTVPQLEVRALPGGRRGAPGVGGSTTWPSGCGTRPTPWP